MTNLFLVENLFFVENLFLVENLFVITNFQAFKLLLILKNFLELIIKTIKFSTSF